ncbi:MAG TPA: hypothetical protein VKT50_00600 [Candidatus Acidoferrales bacterium]|nr:hypothetical protein [Candidatus Acidoferrales bacterium]
MMQFHVRSIRLRNVLTFAILLLFGFACAMFATAAAAQERAGGSAEQAGPPTIDSATSNLKMRAIGPAIMGGRIDDFAVVESNPETIYMGAAAGGVWKSVDGGMTWKSTWDNEPNPSIGALAVAPSNPSVIYVGTGEANNRQSASWGNGVYKSSDAGNTWTHVGLDDTQAIGRIVIDPKNSDVAYVAAVGHLWGPNAERGLFKTSDGGKTWNKVLFINDDTGVNDVAIDPQSPTTLYAAAYERRRTAWGFNGGGPGSGIYKTTDGGATWNKLTKDLPDNGNTGRIGLAVYRRNPSIVYALVQNEKGGVFRSEDSGATWTKMSATDPRPSYFSQIRIDPNNDLRIWTGGVELAYSEDGGKTFVTTRGREVHSDFHAIWIDPNNSNYMLAGCDGGVYESRDAGRDWDHLNVMALGQAYEVGYDNQQPYHVCAGYQDNAEWCGPSRTVYAGGISNSDWLMVGGGDGFYVKPDAEDPQTIYTESQDGNLSRRDLRTNEALNIRPVPPEGQPPYRFNWNSPLLISPKDHNTIYYGGNFLFKSTDRGNTWTRLGGDLTTGVDRNTLPILGQLPSKDTQSLYDGVEWYPTITTIDESPVNTSVLWVGTDDGNLQVSRDGGQNWKNVADRVPGVPKGTYVTRVVASKTGDGTAYVTFDGHRSNDFHVYLFKTTNYGQTWKSISAGLPESTGTVHVIREHPDDPNMLFVGMEFGAYFSLDGGGHWNKLGMGLPTVPVDDIQIQPRENDLILATHGRSIYILDNMTALQHLNDKVLGEDLHLFPIRDTIAWRIYQNRWFDAQQVFLGPNPPEGASIDFYLKAKPAKEQKVKITVLDSSGKIVREITDAKPGAGINRVDWDLRYDPPVKPTPEQLAAQAQGFFGGGARGPMVEPGTYTVKVALGDDSQTQTVKVEEDPRIQISATDRAARHDMQMQLYDLYKRADEGAKTIGGLKKSLTDTLAAWKKPGAPKIPDDIRKQAEALSKKVNDLSGKFVTERGAGGAGGPLHYTPPPLPQRVGRLMFQLEGYTAAPTQGEKDEMAGVSQELSTALDSVHAIVDTDLANLNKALRDANVPYITIGPPEPPPRRGE